MGSTFSQLWAEMARKSKRKSRIPIPTGLDDLERQIYKPLLTTKQRGLPVVVITDIAKDYDDMAALLVLSELHRLGLIELRAVVANLMPANKRAKMTREMLDLLTLDNVPVGIGTRGCIKDHEVHGYEFDWEIQAISEMKDEDFQPGEALLYQTYMAAKKSGEKITLVQISSLADIEAFASKYQDLFASTTLSIQIQGSNQFIDGKLTPNRTTPAANNLFDPDAAERFHALLQKLEIPSTTFTKQAAFGVSLPNDLFRQLAATKMSIGIYLDWLHFEITKQFYADSVNNPYKADLTPQVILKTRTTWFEKHDTNDPLPSPDDIRPYLKRPILYDAIAALGVLNDETLELMSSAGKEEWGVSRPFTPDMRGGIHGEVGQVDEKIKATFHPERMGLLLTTLMKGALLRGGNAPIQHPHPTEK